MSVSTRLDTSILVYWSTGAALPLYRGDEFLLPPPQFRLRRIITEPMFGIRMARTAATAAFAAVACPTCLPRPLLVVGPPRPPPPPPRGKKSAVSKSVQLLVESAQEEMLRALERQRLQLRPSEAYEQSKTERSRRQRNYAHAAVLVGYCCRQPRQHAVHDHEGNAAAFGSGKGYDRGRFVS